MPTQEVEKVTGALKLPKESTTTLVPPLSPGIADTVSVDGRREKSVIGVPSGLTGARTAIEPEIMTGISVE